MSQADSTTPILAVDQLEQRLHDPESGESFVVTVPERLAIFPGTFAALLGPSGCGKTTLLSVLGLLRRPSDSGSVGEFIISGRQADGSLATYDLKQLWSHNCQTRIEQLRRRHIGFALQSGELLSSLTVRENIAIPLRLNGFSRRETHRRVDELLSAFGLNQCTGESNGSTGPVDDTGNHSSDHNRLANARINKLSGGEYQRVVLSRAIAHRPRLVFVDEPTSALNRELARASLRQLKQSQLEGEDPGAVVMITHDETLASEFADMTIRMAPEKNRAAGRVVEILTAQPVSK
ncbi:ABC transporter ATP-binding protein [Novipirellula sp.]|uniref:ABC transporter ATP-binding protein n=1 Tax=Novipirellula sp. TaxID=2795430 RepID=UPI00356A491D